MGFLLAGQDVVDGGAIDRRDRRAAEVLGTACAAIVSIDANTARRCCAIAATRAVGVAGEHALDDVLVLAVDRREPRGVLERQEAHAVELRLRVLDRAPDARPAGHRDQLLVHAVVERDERRVVAARRDARLLLQLRAQVAARRRA